MPKKAIKISFSKRYVNGKVDEKNTFRSAITPYIESAKNWSISDYIAKYSRVPKGQNSHKPMDFLIEVVGKEAADSTGLDSIITLGNGECLFPDESEAFVYKPMNAVNFDFGSTKQEIYQTAALKYFQINSPYLKNRYGSIGSDLKMGFSEKNKDHRRTRVFIFLKVLVGDEKNSSIGTSIVDVTDHIESIEYSKTHEVSKMVLNLAHKTKTYQENGRGNQIYKGYDTTKLTQNQSLYDSNIEGGAIRAKTFAYNISVNDVVLSTDEDFEPSRSNDYDPNNITPTMFWSNIKSLNFIGLVDFPTSISDVCDLRSSIICSDLSKLLTIDGTYWYMLGKSSSEGGVFTGTNKTGDADRGLFNDETMDYDKEVQGRFLPTGALYDFTYYQNRTIIEFLQFIIGNLTNLEICPSDSILVELGQKNQK